jgi:endonuclease/exonuclease/phosphatase family metal-dependent hydrolase
MNIIVLNIWGGRAGKENLLSFFRTYKDTTDIFCLQEVWRAAYDEELKGVDVTNVVTNSLQEITAILGDAFECIFHPHYKENYGMVMFVRNEIEILESGEKYVHKFKEFVPEDNVGKHARNIQYVKIGEESRPLTIINFHGLWNGEGKGDSEDRILQSQNTLDFIATLPGEVVLAGDFNLLPETRSIQMFEESGLQDLIKDYGITSTRTSYYPRPLKYADYAFVSRGVEVVDFRVLPEEVSDHAALLLVIK